MEMYLGCLDSDGDGVADFADKFQEQVNGMIQMEMVMVIIQIRCR